MRKKPVKPHIWTEEEKAFVFDNYIGTDYINMHKKLVEKFGIELTRCQVKSFYCKYKLNSGVSGRFEKGHVNANPHPVYLNPNSIRTRFKKGHKPHNQKPVGTITEAYDRYRIHKFFKIKIAEPNVWKFLHIFNWENVNGPYDKKKYMLIFLDGNNRNCDISNLRLVRKVDNALLNHYKLRYGYQTDQELDTCINIARLKRKVYQKKGEIKKNVRN